MEITSQPQSPLLLFPSILVTTVVREVEVASSRSSKPITPLLTVSLAAQSRFERSSSVLLSVRADSAEGEGGLLVRSVE